MRCTGRIAGIRIITFWLLLTFLAFSTFIKHERRQTNVPGAHLAHCQDPKYPRSLGNPTWAAPVNRMKYKLDLIRKCNIFAHNWCTQNIALSCPGIFMIYGYQMYSVERRSSRAR